MTRLKKTRGGSATDGAPTLLKNSDMKHDWINVMDTVMQIKASIVPLTTFCTMTCAHQAFPHHHKGPDSAALQEMPSKPGHGVSINAEAASPTPIPWSPIHHPSPSYREAAVTTQAATLLRWFPQHQRQLTKRESKPPRTSAKPAGLS